jgi:hypothetical protein
MERKYSKDNPLPKVELMRMRRNTQRRIRARSKVQIAPETLEQFKRILFETVNSKNKELTSDQLKTLDSEIKERIEDLVFNENDARSAAATKLKELFAGYGMSKRDLSEAVRRTKWAKLSDEIFNCAPAKNDIFNGAVAVVKPRRDDYPGKSVADRTSHHT